MSSVVKLNRLGRVRLNRHSATSHYHDLLKQQFGLERLYDCLQRCLSMIHLSVDRIQIVATERFAACDLADVVENHLIVDQETFVFCFLSQQVPL